MTFSLVALYFANLNKLKYEQIDEIKVHQNLIQEYSGKILIDNKVKKKLDEKLLFYISNYENLKNFNVDQKHESL